MYLCYRIYEATLYTDYYRNKLLIYSKKIATIAIKVLILEPNNHVLGPTVMVLGISKRRFHMKY